MRLPGCHIILDFEATGLDPERAEPLEVAALKVREGQVIERYTSVIRPRGAVPPRIIELTGLDPAALVTAPLPAQVAGELAAFCGTAKRISHNARYDETLLRRLLGGSPQGLALDSLELSHFVRPDLRSHALAALCKTLAISPGPRHRALADTEALLAVVEELLAQLAARPAQLRAILTPLRGSDWGWLEVLRALPSPKAAGRPNEEVVQNNLGADEGLRAADFFSSDPIQARSFAHVLPNFELRPQQGEMASAVEQALQGKQHALIEAPTGVGKGLAYLVPAALFARRTGVPVLVSTNTKALQDQLRSRDLRLLAAALGPPLRWQVVKGRANYVCLARWRDLVQSRGLHTSPEELLALAYLGAVAEGPTDGELDDLHPFMREYLPPLAAIAERVRGSDCNGQRGHEACPTGRVARRAVRAHLLIVNHSVLVSGSQLLPQVRHAIVDEAHALEERALSVLAQSLSGTEIERLGARLGPNPERGGASRRLQQAIAHAKQDDDLALRVATAAQALLAAHHELSRFAEMELFAPQRTQNNNGGAYAAEQQERQLEGLAPGHKRKLAQQLDRLAEALIECRQCVDGASRWLARRADGSARRRLLERALGDLKFELFERAEVLESFRSAPERREVRVLQQRPANRGGWLLRADPIAISTELHEQLFCAFDSVVLTSATLSLHDQGRFLVSRLGYPDPDKGRSQPLLKLSSPWDLSAAAINLLVEDLPAVGEAEARARAMAALLESIVSVLRGRTLVLFSAATRMRRTAELCRPAFSDRGLTLLEHYRDGSVDHLLRTMRSDRQTVLFGLASFWTGVDIAGPALSCVVIERIPFSSQHRPIIAARMADESEGYRGFERYLLPAALLDLRQGAGRLLRGAEDRGIVVLCHEGLSGKKYAPAAWAMLPGDNRKVVPAAEIEGAVREAVQALGIASAADPAQG